MSTGANPDIFETADFFDTNRPPVHTKKGESGHRNRPPEAVQGPVHTNPDNANTATPRVMPTLRPSYLIA